MACRHYAVRLYLAAAVLLCTMVGVARPKQSLAEHTDWFDASRLTASKLSQPVSVHWRDVPVSQAVSRLGKSQQLNIWLDRRIDPAMEIDLSVQDMLLGEVIDELASQLQAGAVATGEIVYVGPSTIVSDLRTLMAISHDQLQQLSPASQERMLRHTPLELPRLVEPREVVRQMADRGAMAIENIHMIPHDVWRAGELPAMALVDQLTVVLAGFDLTWRPTSDRRAIRLVAINRPVVVERLQRRAEIEGLQADTLAAVAVRPGPDEQQVWVAAPIEIHAQLAGRGTTTAAKRPQQASRQVYSLRVDQQPVGKILEQLARQLGKQLRVPQGLKSKPVWNERVSFEVRDADLGELLDAACQSAGLAAKLDGEAIDVFEVER